MRLATEPLHPLRRLVRYIVGRGETAVTPDAELLRRFIAGRDETAFAALVARHGPVVRAACRRVLGDTADADDAFQATFVVLVRRAGAIARPELLGNWLYGTAYRTACRARVDAARRRMKERRAASPAAATPPPTLDWIDVRPILDEEIDRLPERFRTPFVLCHVEGKTNEEAARLLGCPKGTVASRLAAARQRLRGRLARRGVALSAGLPAAALSDALTRAALPPGAAEGIARTASSVAASGPTGVVPPGVLSLADGVSRAMLLAELRLAAAIVLVALLATAAGLALYQANGGPPAPPAAPAAPAPVPRLAVAVPPQAAAQPKIVVAVGAPVNGLCAGLAFRAGRRPYRAGEKVSLVFSVANISKQPISFAYDRPTFFRGGSPTVVDATGKRMHLFQPAVDIPVQSVEVTLAPGEAIDLGDPGFEIRAPDAADGGAMTTLFAGPGRYRVRQHLALRGVAGSPFARDAELSSGNLELEIAGAE